MGLAGAPSVFLSPFCHSDTVGVFGDSGKDILLFWHST